MKNFILKTFALTLLLIASATVFSQDKIILKNQSSITCTVTELGQDFISYTQEDTKDLVFKMEVAKIEKIIFESGKELSYTDGDNESVFTQDRIYKKNQDVIVCKITELGEEYVKYTQEDTKELVFSMDVIRIEKVVFASGKELVFTDRMADTELYYGQSKNAFKVGIFSPATGALSLGYERSLKPGASLDFTLGMIGFGYDVNGNNPAGAYFDAGYKFIMTPNFRSSGVSYGHLLRGFYFKPKFALAMYGRDFSFYNNNTGFYGTKRKQVVAGAFTIDMGWQWIIGDVFLLNMYGGFGYGFDNVSSADYGSYYDSYDEPQYHYGFTVGGQIPLAFTAGLKIGFTK